MTGLSVFVPTQEFKGKRVLITGGTKALAPPPFNAFR